ncbi:hypothetical protein [Sphingomonas sp. PB4P5]|uniref:hypothetical protein n=1 Tax=Parasphingomonas puruogangriensis TaxID=3096155 RepID=UPI002FCA043B
MLSPPNPDKLVDLRIAHLTLIQGVISRMSGFSASAKNFCITINAAIIAVAFQKQVPWLGMGAAMVLMLFGLMDSYYLSLERRYRALYEDVASRALDVLPNMTLKADVLNWKLFRSSIASVSVFPFYLLLMASMGGLLYLADHVQSDSSKAPLPGVGGPAGSARERAQQPAALTISESIARGRKPATAQRIKGPIFDPSTNSIASTGEPIRARYHAAPWCETWQQGVERRWFACAAGRAYAAQRLL